MNFKRAAAQILKEAGSPLHYQEITERAVKNGLLKTVGRTPWATMNAQLSVEIKNKGKGSRFIRTGSGHFALNSNQKPPKETLKKQRPKKALSEEFVKNSMVMWLTQNGWKILEISNLKGKGVDIKAKKGNRYFFIETKGQSEIRQSNEVAFVYGLGQIITRMKVVDAPRAYNYGLALPETGAKIAIRRIPWKVAEKLTLYVISVDERGRIKRYSWQEIKKIQSVGKGIMI